MLNQTNFNTTAVPLLPNVPFLTDNETLSRQETTIFTTVTISILIMCLITVITSICKCKSKLLWKDDHIKNTIA